MNSELMPLPETIQREMAERYGQLAMFPESKGENKHLDYAKKRRWEDAFQRWSDEQGMDGAMSYGCCGYGSMCDWCKDNSYGRPCVRALNSMLREKNLHIDYDDTDFEAVWSM